MGATALAIKLRCASWDQLATVYERDIRRGSFFLKTQKPPPLGTEIRIDLTVPSGTVVTLDGRVARHVAPGGRGPGVDLVLARVAPSTMWVIESALASAGKAVAAPAPAAVDLGLDPATTAVEEPDAAEAEFDLVQALEAELAGLRAMNPFQILGVGYEAGDEEIRAAFATLSKKYHPDRFARYESERARNLASEIFILVRDAYRKIGDPTARATTRAAMKGRVAAARPAAAASPPPAAPAAPAARSPAPVAPPPPLPLKPPTPAFEPSKVVTMRQGGPAAAPAPPPRAPAAPAAGLSAESLFGDIDDLGGDAASSPAPPPALDLGDASSTEDAERFLDAGRYDDAFSAFDEVLRSFPTSRSARVGRELAQGFKKLEEGDRMAAAQFFEAALEIDPMNERAARELAAMRRAATESRRGLLGKLLGRKT